MKKKHIKILLVDDEPDVVEIIRYNLDKEGYKLITASNGKEKACKKNKAERGCEKNPQKRTPAFSCWCLYV